jgi:hypothetical protein
VIVVEPRFGEQLAALTDASPIWIADTEENGVAARQLWPARSSSMAITTFRIDPEATPEAWLLEILDDVDLHHGSDAHDPPWQRIRCYGAGLSAAVTDKLAAYGVREFLALPDGFLASKVGPAVG